MAPSIKTVASFSTHQKYFVDFFGDSFFVTVTPTPSVIKRWISTVLYFNRRRYSSSPLVVGVGVQWTPFGYNSDPPADTLQLCVGTRCLIIQLSHCHRVPNALRNFLADPDTIFVGIWNHRDSIKLEETIHELEIGELLDIRKYVGNRVGRNLSRFSFEEIVEVCMGYKGVRLDPDISLSDWTAYNLGHDQILQASLDAHVCFKLGVWARIWEF